MIKKLGVTNRDDWRDRGNADRGYDERKSTSAWSVIVINIDGTLDLHKGISVLLSESVRRLSWQDDQEIGGDEQG
jgi:hypothetical protein